MSRKKRHAYGIKKRMQRYNHVNKSNANWEKKFDKLMKFDYVLISFSVVLFIGSPFILPHPKLLGEFEHTGTNILLLFSSFAFVLSFLRHLKSSVKYFKKITIWTKAKRIAYIFLSISITHGTSYFFLYFPYRTFTIHQEVKNARTLLMTLDIVDEHFNNEDDVGILTLNLSNIHETFIVSEDAYELYEENPNKEFQVDLKLRKGFSNYFVVDHYRIR